MENNEIQEEHQPEEDEVFEPPMRPEDLVQQLEQALIRTHRVVEILKQQCAGLMLANTEQAVELEYRDQEITELRTALASLEGPPSAA